MNSVHSLSDGGTADEVAGDPTSITEPTSAAPFAVVDEPILTPDDRPLKEVVEHDAAAIVVHHGGVLGSVKVNLHRPGSDAADIALELTIAWTMGVIGECERIATELRLAVERQTTTKIVGTHLTISEFTVPVQEHA
jgi:hypothetical protein